jgi:hypothetical protein
MKNVVWIGGGGDAAGRNPVFYQTRYCLIKKRQRKKPGRQ